MDPLLENRLAITRRYFFGRAATGMGAAALASLIDPQGLKAATPPPPSHAASGDSAVREGALGLPHFAPRAKRVIYLFQSGAPSQMDLFDYKPKLERFRGAELPDSVRMGQRLTGMTATQASFPVAPSSFKFARHGKSGV